LNGSNANAFNVFGVGGNHRPPTIIGPVSPGGFLNPLGGSNGSHHGHSKGGTGIILLGAGYGYDYAADYQDQDQTQDQAQVDDPSGGQQSEYQQQPQYIFVQQVPDPRGQNQQIASEQTQAPVERESVSPLPDVGSFTLVTRDGNQLDAVAFTRSNDRLVYITPDGGRRTLAFSDLDVGSTQRLNEERGTPVELPSADAPPAAKHKAKASAEITN
jgi:hypothetical protein